MLPDEPAGPGLYIHIPFCLRRCRYCSFFSRDDVSHLQPRYLAALKRQIRRLGTGRETHGQVLSTIFFGGGTPSMLAPDELVSLLAEIRSSFQIAEDAEISVEVNPATVQRPGYEVLRCAGFNRLSMGIQSFVDSELRRLGRPHSAAQGMDAFQNARAAGFANLSLDLMYGLPGQDMESWRMTLEQALALHPEHLSIYELSIEEGTPFAALQADGHLDLPDEDTVLRMHALALKLTECAGLHRYEISNYAVPGYRCRHNLIYWHNGPYLGAGAGAVAHVSGRRCRAVASIREYCRRIEEGRPVWEECETLDQEARFRETVIMGLRLIRGIHLDGFRQRFGIDVCAYYGATLDRLMEQGLLEIRAGHLRLSETGLLLANRVMAELV